MAGKRFSTSKAFRRLRSPLVCHGYLVRPEGGLNINPNTLDAKSVAAYAGQARAQSVTDLLMHKIPATVVNASAKGDILQVLLLAILLGSRCLRGKELTSLLRKGWGRSVRSSQILFCVSRLPVFLVLWRSVLGSLVLDHLGL